MAGSQVKDMSCARALSSFPPEMPWFENVSTFTSVSLVFLPNKCDFSYFSPLLLFCQTRVVL